LVKGSWCTIKQIGKLLCFMAENVTPRVLSPFRGEGVGGGGLSTSMTQIAMLTGVVILLVGRPKSDRLRDSGLTK